MSTRPTRPRTFIHLFFAFAALLAIMVGGGNTRAFAAGDDHDTLSIGDGGDNTVKQYDAQTGALLRTLTLSVTGPHATRLNGPRGILARDDALLVVNQNVNTPFNGEVLQYDLEQGRTTALVSRDDPTAPEAPRGIVLKHYVDRDVLFVADLGDDKPAGSVSAYHAQTGAFLGNLPLPTGFSGQFHPRGLVFGPDGRLYVSGRNIPEPCGGGVLRYDVPTSDPATWRFPKDGVFVANPGACTPGLLHRPEGLVFGPNGNLYVTSFNSTGGDPTDTDKILVYNARGKPVDHIDLDTASQPRTFAQALLFGPGGKLFVPINNTGEVRRYDVKTKTFNSFVPAGTALTVPWYLTFDETDPATLAYR